MIANGVLTKNNFTGYTKPLPFTVKSDTVTFNFQSDEDNIALPDNLVASWKANIVIISPRGFASKDTENDIGSILNTR